METLPIKLNFFKRAEQFLELLRLDKQYDLMISDLVKNNEFKKDIPSSATSINLPTWNIEKKILYWTFLKHKHLGSELTVDYLNKPDFQKDLKVTNEEIKFSGAQHIIDNLIVRGFASDRKSKIVISSDGLLVGSLIANSYIFTKEKVLDFEYKKLIPSCIKKIGYELTYYSSWLIIFETIIFLSFQLLSIVGLIDDLKLLLPKNILIWPSVFISFMPIILLILGLFLIWIKKTKNE